MANSKIILTFRNDLEINEGIGFNRSEIGSTFIIPMNFVWRNIRSGYGQVTIGTPTLIQGERSAINFVEAFNLDFNNPYISNYFYTVSRNENVVTIENNFTNALFSDFYCHGFDSAGLPISSLDVIAEITNNATDFFQITNQTFITSTTPCSKVNLSIKTNQLATKIISPIAINNNTLNPFVLELQRQQTITLLIEDANGQQISQVIQAPSILDPNSFQIEINSNPSGATVVVNNTNIQFLFLQYSLDNLLWQTDNFFNSLADGDYKLYVKDNYGCSFSKDFNVIATGIYLPYFYISKSNSIRFANRVSWGDSGNYKNDENTLSCEVGVKNAFKQIQLFQTSDIITTQFKSNYAINTVKIIKSDLTEVNVPVLKKSYNIGLSDSRDARKYNLGNGKTGVYFTTGNVYDFNTGIDTGEDHSLNGTLPYWAKAGNYIKTGTAWFLIESIIYDEMKNSDVIIFSNIYTGPDTTVIVGSKYNKFDYEIYEFAIDMLTYMDEDIRVSIEATDPNFATINLLSEQINVKVRQEKTVEIDYWNDDNTDVFYSTGIRHKIRVLLTKKAGVSEDENEVLKTDSTAVTLSSQLYELDQFTFEPLTKELWRKLLIALSCKNVIIDEVGYVKTESGFENEGPLEKSNLYVLKAKMIKNSGSFKSTSDGNTEFDYGNVSIPGLIDIGNDGFIKY